MKLQAASPRLETLRVSSRVSFERGRKVVRSSSFGRVAVCQFTNLTYTTSLYLFSLLDFFFNSPDMAGDLARARSRCLEILSCRQSFLYSPNPSSSQYGKDQGSSPSSNAISSLPSQSSSWLGSSAVQNHPHMSFHSSLLPSLVSTLIFFSIFSFYKQSSRYI